MVPSIIENDQNVFDDPHLRSCKKVSHYALVCRDGAIGFNVDMLIDDSLWIIRFIIADVNSSHEHRQIIYGPQIIDDIEWALATVNIESSCNQVLGKPEFDASRHLDTSYEVLVGDLYNLKDIEKKSSH